MRSSGVTAEMAAATVAANGHDSVGTDHADATEPDRRGGTHPPSNHLDHSRAYA